MKKRIAITVALALVALSLAGLAVAAKPKPTIPSITGMVQSIHKDSKGTLVSLVLQTTDKAGKTHAVTVAVTKGTKFQSGANCCATASVVQARAKATVQLKAWPANGRATATLVNVVPVAKPAPTPAPAHAGGG